MKQLRKTPYHHRVQSHMRNRKHVSAYYRGIGVPTEETKSMNDWGGLKATKYEKKEELAHGRHVEEQSERHAWKDTEQPTLMDYEEYKERKKKFAKEHEEEMARIDRQHEEFQREQERAQREYINNHPRDKAKLDDIIDSFNRTIDKGLVFYSWIQEPLKREFGKKYPYEYFDYAVEKLRKMGYQFLME